MNQPLFLETNPEKPTPHCRYLVSGSHPCEGTECQESGVPRRAYCLCLGCGAYLCIYCVLPVDCYGWPENPHALTSGNLIPYNGHHAAAAIPPTPARKETPK